jgi:hypothetical protein
MSSSEQQAALRWGATLHFCSICQYFINDGTERAWTGQYDAPVGEWRYYCTACKISLCQKCFDLQKHDQKHALEFISPVTSKREAHARNAKKNDEEVDARNPWNNFRGGLSSQSLQRLSQRTGYKF